MAPNEGLRLREAKGALCPVSTSLNARRIAFVWLVKSQASESKASGSDLNRLNFVLGHI